MIFVHYLIPHLEIKEGSTFFITPRSFVSTFILNYNEILKKGLKDSLPLKDSKKASSDENQVVRNRSLLYK